MRGRLGVVSLQYGCVHAENVLGDSTAMTWRTRRAHTAYGRTRFERRLMVFEKSLRKRCAKAAANFVARVVYSRHARGVYFSKTIRRQGFMRPAYAEKIMFYESEEFYR